MKKKYNPPELRELNPADLDDKDKITFSQIPHYWPIFSADFDSLIKSLWLGWWLITWSVNPDWWHTRSWPITEFSIDFRPEG